MLDKEKRKHKMFLLLSEISIIEQLVANVINDKLPDGFLISHFGVINHMCRLGDGKMPSELAKAFQVSKASMNNTLNKLLKKDFIKVGQNPDDARSKLVFLTNKGQEIRDKSLILLEPALENLEENLDLDNILKALPLLKELREYIDNNRGL